MHRSLAAVLLVSALTLLQTTAVPASAQEAAFCRSGESPQFTFGFAVLKAQLGAAMGDPIECAHPNSANGDVLQNTTTGLSFWRKSTNTPTFTNGWEHWGLTPGGSAFWTGDSIDPPGTAVAAAPPPPAPAPAASAPRAPAPAAAPARRIGDTTVLTTPAGLRIAVTVNGRENNVPPPTRFALPSGRYVALDWTVKNEGSIDLNLNRLDFKIQTADGFLIDRSVHTAREPDLASGTLGTGQVIRGWLTYDVPIGQQVKAAVYQPVGARQFVIADLSE